MMHVNNNNCANDISKNDEKNEDANNNIGKDLEDLLDKNIDFMTLMKACVPKRLKVHQQNGAMRMLCKGARTYCYITIK